MSMYAFFPATINTGAELVEWFASTLNIEKTQVRVDRDSFSNLMRLEVDYDDSIAAITVMCNINDCFKQDDRNLIRLRIDNNNQKCINRLTQAANEVDAWIGSNSKAFFRPATCEVQFLFNYKHSDVKLISVDEMMQIISGGRGEILHEYEGAYPEAICAVYTKKTGLDATFFNNHYVAGLKS